MSNLLDRKILIHLARERTALERAIKEMGDTLITIKRIEAALEQRIEANKLEDGGERE